MIKIKIRKIRIAEYNNIDYIYCINYIYNIHYIHIPELHKINILQSNFLEIIFSSNIRNRIKYD